MILKTQNLVLRPWVESDAESLYYFAKNPKVGLLAGWPPHQSVEDSLIIIKTFFQRPECYAIVKDDIAIGCIDLLIHPGGNHWWGEGCAEIGYWIGEEYWGRGLVVEACEVLIKRAFEDLNIENIYATYKVENTQSKRVLEKLGFKYYGELDNLDYKNQIFHEIAMVLKNNLNTMKY